MGQVSYRRQFGDSAYSVFLDGRKMGTVRLRSLKWRYYLINERQSQLCSSTLNPLKKYIEKMYQAGGNSAITGAR